MVQRSERQEQLIIKRDTKNLIKGLSYRTNLKKPLNKSSAFLSTSRGLVEEETAVTSCPGSEVGRYRPRFDLVEAKQV